MRLLRAALAVALLTAAVTSCGDAPAAPEPVAEGQPAGETWRRLPDPPLSPRDHVVVVGVDDRLLVVGGWEFRCPPMGDCAMPDAPLLADGAVYDRSTDSWSRIADAPFGLRRQEYATATLDESAYLLSGCAGGPACDSRPRLLSYDLASDRWTDLGAVPGPDHYRHLVAVGQDLVAYSDTDEHGEGADLVFDPETATWTELPDDPMPAAFDRFMVPAGDSIVLTGSSVDALDAGEDTTSLAARFTLDTRRWSRLPDPPGQGYQLLPTDRGPLLNGHFGDAAGWVLDPETWTWSELPRRADDATNLSGVIGRESAVYDIPNSVGELAAADRLVVYDGRTENFVTIPAPPGRENVYDDASTAWRRDLVVVGGQRWPDGAKEGELVSEAWLWTAPKR